MEFREYWQMIWRRRHLVVPLVVVTFLASLVFNLVLPPVYKAETTVQVLAVIPRPIAGVVPYYSEEYYRTVYSEYITDDLSVIVKSKDFADKIASRIRSRYGQEVDVKDLADAMTTKKLHRTLKITVVTGSELLTQRIADATDETLRTDAWRYFSGDERQPVQINVVDPARKPTSPNVLRRLLEVMLHASVAFVVGVGLAFLLHYLDDHVQDEEDATRTYGLPVLGAIPPDDSDPLKPASVPSAVWSGLLNGTWRRKPAS